MLRLYKHFLLTVILIYGCGTPNDPEVISDDGGYKIISKYLTSGYAQDVIVEDSIAYIAQGEGGLVMLNIADPYHPQELATMTDSIKGYSYKILKKDSAVYLAAGNFGISVINAADPVNPVLINTNVDPRPARDMIIHQNYLLTSLSELGVIISEISDVTQPDNRGSIETPGYARGLCITPDSNYILVACGEMGFAMIDISVMANGYGYYPTVGWIDTYDYAMDVTCHPELPYAYIACGAGGLVIVDYSDKTNMKITGTYSTGGYAKEIEYKDGKIFVTTEGRGLQIINVSDVTAPARIAVVDTEYALGLSITEKFIYVADQVEGLIIISIP